MLPFNRNGNSSTLACLFVAARMCLATRCLAIYIHVIILNLLHVSGLTMQSCIKKWNVSICHL
jgi:hypothetical protein